jgi:Carboxypeptidase regulatory-like domain/TonB dependent receptor
MFLSFNLRQGLFILSCAFLASNLVNAQETRGSILGTVTDPSGAVVSGATVIVTNTDTNISATLITNDKGYFEAPYQLAGTYTITATATGFKQYIRQGFVLTVNARAVANITLEIGTTSESVTVTADAPLLDTTTAGGSTTFSNQEIMDLPLQNNSALLLARSAPGIQWTGDAAYLGPHSNFSASTVNSAGGVGGNEFTLDGVPNSTSSALGVRRVAVLPYADTVREIKIESSPFDASKGSTGASISVVSNSGTNTYHGSATWQHWQQRWNATPTTLNQAYWGAIKAAEARGDMATAEQLRRKERQEPGRSNNWAASLGGPVRIPRLFNGKDRLFFFFSYNGLKESKTEDPRGVRFTVPTLKQRQGDFSELLAIDPQRYQIYDPRTARNVTGGVCGRNSNGTDRTCVVRDPFPNNQVPILNPLYKFYLPLIPLPNNVPGIVNADGLFNYLASGMPYNWDYKSYGGRIDYVISPRHRMFGRYNYNTFLEDRNDWTYESMRGLHQNGLDRTNHAITLDHVFTINATTILNTAISLNRYREGDTQNAVQRSFGPDSVGLPSYLTERAGEFKHLPVLDFTTNTNTGQLTSYSDFSRTYLQPGHFSTGTIRGELTKIHKNHSTRFGYDLRERIRQVNNPGNTSGSIQPRNTYLRETNITTTNGVGLLGLEWASFMLGVPGNSVTVNKTDSYYLTNKYYGFYVQDDWRVSTRLTINAGLRVEREAGFHERYNRAVVNFDPNAELPIAAAAQAAYAAAPLPELPPDQFVVKGGSVYLGQNGFDASHLSENMFMPRIGIVYMLNNKTVVRGGYGLFYDTNNVLNNELNQFGYNRDTSTPVSTTNGLSFTSSNLTTAECIADVAVCTTIFNDPFPVRPDGTRFNVPFGNALGLMAGVGTGIGPSGVGYITRDWKHARQQRWRFSLQRELSKNMVFEFAYVGSRSDNISVTRRIDALPEQYWATGLIRNNALTENLNSQFPNPFNINNFASFQTSNPQLYQYMASNGFFTGTTRSRADLLRPFGHVTNSSYTRAPLGESRFNSLEFTLNKRFSRGMQFMASYVRVWNQEAVMFSNEFDALPEWRPSNNSRPHSVRLNATWDLPVGRGHRFLSNSRVANIFLGGWRTSAIYNFRSGGAMDTGNWFYYGDDLRALVKSGDERNSDEWFNWQLLPGAARDYTSANRSRYEARIRQIVPQSVLTQMGNICGPQNNTACTYENVTPTNFQPTNFHRRVFPQRVSFLQTPIANQIDLNISRTIPISEKLKMHFRTDFINAFNHVNYGGPNNDINSSNFGRITTQANTPRWIQFQLRLQF